MRLGDLSDVTVVFDLDGTLVDTAPDLLRALNQTLDLEGLDHPSAKVMRGLVGQGARALIERAAALQGVRFAPARLEALTEAFVRFYRDDIAAESVPFADAPEAIETLRAAGATLAVCTNKRTDLAVALLEALDLAASFTAIVGADAVTARKPAPEHFAETVARAGGQVSRAIMLGDSEADVGSARAAGAPVIVARFGYGPDDPESLAADGVFDSFYDAVGMIDALMRPR